MTPGFLIRASSQANVIEIFGEASSARRLVSVSSGDQIDVVLMGRLLYKRKLLRRLEGRVNEGWRSVCRSNDAALVRTLYRLDGPTALHHLQGEFSLACCDHRRGRLLAMRDPMGGYPTFWIHLGDSVAVSTSIRPLFDLLGDLRPDPEYMLDYLLFPDAGISELPRERTAYCGINRLRPGFLLESRRASAQVEIRPWWHWPDKLLDLPPLTLEEAGRLVRDKLDAAVVERLSPSAGTASHFSGGFDSTGVALLAAEQLSSKAQTLHALSLVYCTDPMLAQESAYIECALENSSTIIHHAIPGDDLLDFDPCETPPLLDEPMPTVSRFRMNEALIQRASQAGADTILSGEGADQLFDVPPVFLLANLLASGQLAASRWLSRQFGYAQSRSPFDILACSLKLLLPDRFQDGLRAFLGRGRVPFEVQTERTLPPWIRPEFARRHNLRSRVLSLQPSRDLGQLFHLGDLALNVGDGIRWSLAARHGIMISHPFWDTDLICLALSLPPALQVVPDQTKPVLAAALRDVLPQRILRRSRKAHFGALLQGYGRNQEILEKLISEAGVDEEMIDRSILVDCLRKVALGIDGRGVGVARLRVTLSYLFWLEQRKRWTAASQPRYRQIISTATDSGIPTSVD